VKNQSSSKTTENEN